jgi:hypothetical protein
VDWRSRSTLLPATRNAHVTFLADLDFHVNATASRLISLRPRAATAPRRRDRRPRALPSSCDISDNLYLYTRLHQQARQAVRISRSGLDTSRSAEAKLGARGLLTRSDDQQIRRRHKGTSRRTLANHRGGGSRPRSQALAGFLCPHHL